MQVPANVSKILKTVESDLTFVLIFFQNLAFILPSFQECWWFHIKWFLSKTSLCYYV